MSIRILEGDCAEVMKTLPDCSVDAVVTDPPYGLSFMGKKWDYDVPSVAVWTECLRVLKPGGHLLAFAGTRTQHRMAVRIEDAGFEIRDMLAWLYGSGFPKSHNGEWGGTALKPALEPITMARKPLAGTVAANWHTHGTGALNIDGCRIEGEKGSPASPRRAAQGTAYGDLSNDPGTGTGWDKSIGRWPANVLHDGSDEVLAAFPDAPGQCADISSTAPSPKTGNVYGRMAREGEASADSSNEGSVGFKMKPGARRLDAGSAARFFYCAKAAKADRNEGLDDLPTVTADPYGQHRGRRMDGNDTRIDGKPASTGKNHHPTVKPTDLMRYLCRLVTPAGGLVLDPFMGSGSTLKAAELEGFSAIGIELDPAYIDIARRRIAADCPLFNDVEVC